MPPATEWSLVVLQSVRGRVSRLARRVTHLESLHNEQREVVNRLRRLEEAVSVAPAPPARRGDNPLGPLFDALDSINSELTDFAARLALLEDTALPPRLHRRFPRLASLSSVAASMRAARSRIRRAVPGA